MSLSLDQSTWKTHYKLLNLGLAIFGEWGWVAWARYFGGSLLLGDSFLSEFDGSTLRLIVCLSKGS